MGDEPPLVAKRRLRRFPRRWKQPHDAGCCTVLRHRNMRKPGSSGGVWRPWGTN